MVRRWNFWDEMQRLHDSFERLFEGVLPDAWEARPLLAAPTSRELTPLNYRQALADISESDKEIVATVELPGVEKNDIEITATESGVDIKVEKSDERKEEDKKKGVYRLERDYAGFYRHIPLPDGVDTNNIKANYKNGVLELRIPKVEAKKKGKRIAIN